jgi:hypothetical protein
VRRAVVDERNRGTAFRQRFAVELELHDVAPPPFTSTPPFPVVSSGT